MQLFPALTLLLALIAATPAAAKAVKDTVMGRDVYIHLPDTAAEGPRPAVLVLHGGGGNGLQIKSHAGLDAAADKYGFIAAYPDGVDGRIAGMRTWNAGACCGGAAREGSDDVAYLSAVIDRLVAAHGADPARVYATGHSNGAMMSYRLACELSGKIAAIAPVGGQRVLDDCRPARPVPVLHIHGTKDSCALYQGSGTCGGCLARALGLPGGQDYWPCRPVPEIVAEHARMNGCAAETKTVWQNGAATCARYEGCAPGAPVALCSIEGAGHGWPGGTTSSCDGAKRPRMCQRHAAAIGPATNDLDPGEMMWGFFRDLSLP